MDNEIKQVNSARDSKSCDSYPIVNPERDPPCGVLLGSTPLSLSE